MIGVQGQRVVCEAIDCMPGGNVGFAAKGAVTSADCEPALLPLAHFPFDRWCDFGRLAVASDALWLPKAANLPAPFMRDEVRLFHDYEIEQAETWIASTPNANALAYTPRSTWR
jgi:hypothetical protein